MKESIYSIPISEVFEPKCGCPLCSLYQALEERWVEYITGAAMMEPDIRVETNRHGFCSRHFDMMLAQRNRLSVALILQTRLDWINQSLNEEPKPAGLFKKEDPARDSCFVCQKIENEFTRIGSNLVSIWSKETDFRQLYSQQEFLCYPHGKMLLDAGRNSLKRDKLAEFSAATSALIRKQLTPLKADIDSFCNLFDYRNAGGPQPPASVATAIERAIAFLTGADQAGDSPEKP